MSKKDGWSEEETDFLGNKYTQHYDGDGNKIGWSQEETGLLGDKYIQHYEGDGYDKKGWSQEDTGLLGDKYIQHHEGDGYGKKGWSQEETGLLGDKYTQHYEGQGYDKTGWSQKETGWLGDRYTQHYSESGSSSHSRSEYAEPESSSGNVSYESGGYSSVYRTGGSSESYDSSSPNSSRSTSTSFSFFIIVALFVGIALLGISFLSKSRSNTNASVESAYVNTLQLNVRSGPGSEYGIVAKLPQGTSVICYEKSQSGDGGAWVKIRAGTFEGWANQKLLSNNPVPHQVPQNNLIVSFNQVAGVQVGMTLPQASQQLGRRLVQVGEANEGCVYAEPEGGNSGIAFMIVSGQIARIDVTGNDVLSDQGIKIGDPEEKVKSAYAGRIETEPHPYDEKGHYLTTGQKFNNLVPDNEIGSVAIGH